MDEAVVEQTEPLIADEAVADLKTEDQTPVDIVDLSAEVPSKTQVKIIDGSEMACRERIRCFMEQISLNEDLTAVKDSDSERTKDAVTLSTIHQSKGLEWKTVFLVEINEGVIPSIKRRDQVSSNYDRDAEEKRLLFVGMSRAKQELFILASTEPSPFLKENETLWDTLAKESYYKDSIFERNSPLKYEASASGSFNSASQASPPTPTQSKIDLTDGAAPAKPQAKKRSSDEFKSTPSAKAKKPKSPLADPKQPNLMSFFSKKK
eukprot:TRINITY_DN22765_c0_g1_i1.p1 TRINITY_DN22765_c0_g1~~TRINITY_DN22765_c0_g1_i1.p1  ORF type:complete len:285 (+),score=63.44 TRINITY_DN22765_c0_g1_i1:65-856(+)